MIHSCINVLFSPFREGTALRLSQNSLSPPVKKLRRLQGSIRSGNTEKQSHFPDLPPGIPPINDVFHSPAAYDFYESKARQKSIPRPKKNRKEEVTINGAVAQMSNAPPPFIVSQQLQILKVAPQNKPICIKSEVLAGNLIESGVPKTVSEDLTTKSLKIASHDDVGHNQFNDRAPQEIFIEEVIDNEREVVEFEVGEHLSEEENAQVGEVVDMNAFQEMLENEEVEAIKEDGEVESLEVSADQVEIRSLDSVPTTNYLEEEGNESGEDGQISLQQLSNIGAEDNADILELNTKKEDPPISSSSSGKNLQKAFPAGLKRTVLAATTANNDAVPEVGSIVYTTNDLGQQVARKLIKVVKVPASTNTKRIAESLSKSDHDDHVDEPGSGVFGSITASATTDDCDPISAGIQRMPSMATLLRYNPSNVTFEVSKFDAN